MAAAAGARAQTSTEEQPVDGEVVTSPTSSERRRRRRGGAGLEPEKRRRWSTSMRRRAALGLDFQRGSTVLSEIEDSSPLLNKVQVGWTLVKVDREDVSHMNGSQVATRLKMRSRNPRRHLEFKPASSNIVVDAEPASPAPDPVAGVRPDGRAARRAGRVRRDGCRRRRRALGGRDLPRALQE